jgi:Pentapeptide repeats (8 copies)
MAFLYKGLAFECDVTSRLTIEGRPVRVDGKKTIRATLSESKRIKDRSLRRLATRIIDHMLAQPITGGSPDVERRVAQSSGHPAQLARGETRETQSKDHLAKLAQGKERWNEWRSDNPHIRPMLACAPLNRARLSGFDFSYANLCQAQLRHAHLRRANFHQANLAGADLFDADLRGANFCRTDLFETQFPKAKLIGANLQGVQLARTNFKGARLIGCTVYGMSAWDVELEGAIQKGFIIRYRQRNARGEERRGPENEVLVDDLRMAQLTYLRLNNQSFPQIIDTIGQRGVLILGRFSDPARKAVLDKLRQALIEREFIPTIFDFARPKHGDLAETIVLLAGLSVFVIADITNPKSVPLELQAIAPNRSIPIVPIIKEGKRPFSMISSLSKYDWVLDPLVYDTPANLVKGLERAVIRPALAKSEALVEWKSQEPRTRHIRQYLGR